MTKLQDPGVHDYEASEDCSNWARNHTPLEGDEQCTHQQYPTPHCSWCGERQDMPWHTARSR
jgi:hypothetical protein